jgi:hypothetical protein
MPKLSIAPNQAVRGITIKIPVISSAIPMPIRPTGSKPTLVKMATLSGAAVNLNRKVCIKIIAMANRIIKGMYFFMLLIFNDFVVGGIKKYLQKNDKGLLFNKIICKL